MAVKTPVGDLKTRLLTTDYRLQAPFSLLKLQVAGADQRSA
jgi:hypothetical protein